MADTPTRRERAAQRRRRRRRLLIGAGVLVVAIAAGVLALTGGSDAPQRHVAWAPTTTTTTTAPVAEGSTIATVAGEQLDVFAEPIETSEKLATLQPTTTYRVPTTLLVDPRRPPGPEGWLPVTVPIQKPNSTPGWIRETDVTLSSTPYRIVVYRGRHTVELLKGDEVVLESSVIIGAPGSVTPTGTFYVTDPINCNTESVPGYPVATCSGAYGAFVIGTSGLSEQLDSFAGTIPQIALHGTNLPASELGKDLSNGCVRMPNDVILQIARITPLLGTPVTISPY